MFAIWTPGPTEIIITLVVALLLFGNRLPQMARSLGKGVLEFKKGVRGATEEFKAGIEDIEDMETSDVLEAQAAPVEEKTDAAADEKKA